MLWRISFEKEEIKLVQHHQIKSSARIHVFDTTSHSTPLASQILALKNKAIIIGPVPSVCFYLSDSIVADRSERPIFSQKGAKKEIEGVNAPKILRLCDKI